MTHENGLLEKERGVLEVAVSGLARDGGELVCALYDRAETFPKDKGVVAGAYAAVAARAAVCRFENVAPGRYAVAAFHDEDGDRKLKKTALGMPADGYGFSRDARAGTFGPPKFAQAAFDFDGGKQRITIQIHYPR